MRCKVRKYIFFIFLIVFLSSTTLATESFDTAEFIDIVKEYSSEIIPEISNENWLNEVLLGNVDISAEGILNRILEFFLSEFRDNISLLFKIIGIAFLCSILKNIQNSLGGTTSEVAFYVCYMLIIILIITSFTNITGICMKSIKKLSSFMNLLIPILIALLVSMGNIATVTALQPLILIMISIITTLISNIVIPIITISTIFNLISNISSQVNLEKFGKFMKKTVMHVLEFCMIIFLRAYIH